MLLIVQKEFHAKLGPNQMSVGRDTMKRPSGFLLNGGEELQSVLRI